MQHIYSINGLIPVIHETAFVHPSAVIIGDVIIGPRVYVGPLVSLRGDFGRIVMKEGANIQDNCTVHSDQNKDAIIEEDGHIGHGAILHSCVVKRNALIGMSAVVMDDAVIGEDSIVGAMAFVKAGMIVPAKSLVMGFPAKIIKSLSDDDIKSKMAGTHLYHQLVQRSKNTMQKVAPLREVELNRPRLTPKQIY